MPTGNQCACCGATDSLAQAASRDSPGDNRRAGCRRQVVTCDRMNFGERPLPLLEYPDPLLPSRVVVLGRPETIFALEMYQLDYGHDFY